MALSDLLKSGSKSARTAPAVQAAPKAGKAGKAEKVKASEPLPPPAKSVSRPPTAREWRNGQGLGLGFGLNHTCEDVLLALATARRGRDEGMGSFFLRGPKKGYFLNVPHGVPLEEVRALLIAHGIR